KAKALHFTTAKKMGVPAVVGGDASIFSSDDARLMNLMLDVLVDPQRLSSIRTLLTSRSVGLDATALNALLKDDRKWSRMLEIFAVAREDALEKGVLAGIRYLLDALEVEKQLISWSDGERRITNLRHISELIYEEQRRGHRNLAGLAQWLRSRRNDPNLDASDNTQLRLESDENRVVIMTMHSSKGLQFPVVYAPFLWESRDKSKGVALYYSEKDGRFVMDFKNGYSDRLADARGEGNEQAVKGLQVQDAENTEDRVRLMYVAVTRSKYRCYVPHAMAVNSRSKGTDSPFTAMLLRDPAAGLIQWRDLTEFDRATGVDAENVISELLSGLDSSRFCAYSGIIDTDIRYQMESTSDTFTARSLSEDALRRMQQHVFVESYSSLKSQKSHTETDEITDEVMEMIETETAKPEGHSIFSFPRGAHTGTFWHQIFENLDFSDADAIEGLVRETCEEYGFDFEEWGGVLVTMVRNVLGTNLDGFCMADVSLNRTLREMEFYLPYEAHELEEYQKWVELQAMPSDTFVKANVLADISSGGNSSKYYLTGFIDLLVENNGKYYIIDYKSDYLGDRAEDYNIASLNSHMRKNGYIMQYHFYAMALYLYLRDRIEDFDFGRDFGGVYYLFLRGMNGDENGVFADKPDPDQIKAYAERIQLRVGKGEL
ncbi:MAG: PD-(D/E)XK nuclease family protein, partial [Balneolales bacterium]|nr:PD-(D/E)XK nuclease family protein [Balneolales bacterium]